MNRRYIEPIEFQNAVIKYRNFSGEEQKYNREGDRNFVLEIPDRELALQMADDGWNVKEAGVAETPEEQKYQIKVKIKYSSKKMANGEVKHYGPEIQMQTREDGPRIDITEETIDTLDRIGFSKSVVVIRPYQWGEANGKHGVTAYLDSMLILKKPGVADLRFQEDESSDEYF